MPISNDDHLALWARIQAFQFDEGGEDLTFAQRLARENGWPPDFTNRAVEEYRRFMFLAAASGHPVTPSDQVDQVWHLHLTYTRSYWQRWCKDALQTDVHHGPTKGGPAEREKFHEWYVRTKTSYEQVFDAPPPGDIWPPSSQRFGDDIFFQRVNTKRNWIVPRFEPNRALHVSMLLVLCVAIIVGCARQLGEDSGENNTLLTFVVFVAFLAIIYFIRSAIRIGGGRNRRGRGDGGCGGCGTTGSGRDSSHGSDDSGGGDGGCGGCGD